MALTFKKFMTTVGSLPGDAFSGLANLVLGSTGSDREGNPVAKPGILGLLLNGVKYAGRVSADFIAEHKKAISVAGWLSLAAAGGVGLTLFLWPAALTAVATFSVYGLSIAGIVGSNTALQIGFAAGLAAATASVGTYLTAFAVNTFSSVANFFKRSKTSTLKGSFEESNLDKFDQGNSYKTGLDHLSRSNPTHSTSSNDDLVPEPLNTKTLFTIPTEKKSPTHENPSEERTFGTSFS